jgi:hypothetical protein
VVAFVQIYLPRSRIGTSHEHANYTTDEQNSAYSYPGISAGWMHATYQVIQADNQADYPNRDDNIENYRILHFNRYLF